MTKCSNTWSTQLTLSGTHQTLLMDHQQQETVVVPSLHIDEAFPNQTPPHLMTRLSDIYTLQGLRKLFLSNTQIYLASTRKTVFQHAHSQVGKTHMHKSISALACIQLSASMQYKTMYISRYMNKCFSSISSQIKPP